MSEEVREVLVEATETTRPSDAVAFYTAKVERLALSGSGNSYEAAAKLIWRLAELRDPAEHAAYTADIKERFPPPTEFYEAAGLIPRLFEKDGTALQASSAASRDASQAPPAT